MAKAKGNAQEVQLDMFPVKPKIRGLSITEFKIKEGDVIANLKGVTLTGDIAQLDDTVWKKAVAEWLVSLCGNNGSLIDSYIDEARKEAYDRDRELELQQAAMATLNNASTFPSGAVGAII